MKYFTRIQLDERHAVAREAVSQSLRRNAYGDHQFLWNFFAAPDGAARDFLFRRFDPQGDRQQARFYCVSNRPAVSPHAAWQVESREYAPQVHEGDRLLFDVRVNPTQAHRRAGKSHRDDVVMHAKKRIAAEHGAQRWSEIPEVHRPALYELAQEAVREWLCGDGSRTGFAARNGFRVLDDLRVDAYRQHRIGRGGETAISLSTVDLTGTLEVIDPARCTRALLEGIGHAKAFGCGLLLVRRA
jgi:CRISPR system Cascade subunit CasE